MKNLRLLLSGCILVLAAAALSAQDQPARRAAFANIAKPGSTREWLRLREETRITADELVRDHKLALGLTDADELRSVRTETDNLGMTHRRYRQYHNGIPVFASDYIVHEKDGRVVTANGQLTDAPAGLPNPGLSEAKALQTIIPAPKNPHYMWNDEQAEIALKGRSNNQAATYFPKGELTWFIRDTRLDLVWKFDINTDNGTSETVLVHAATGAVVQRIPIDINCNPGNGATTWNGNQNFSTSKSGANFILNDDCGSPNIHVYNGHDSTSTSYATEYTDADNNWTGQTSAVQTFYGLHQARQYYQTVHGRSSYDNGGADIIAYNQAGFKTSSGTTYWSNASWSGSSHVLRFGDNGTPGATDDWNTVDVTGHELTHGVTQYSAGLNYTGESGGLNESFSDIFGEMVEEFAQGSPDWLVGNQRSPGNIRSFINPKSKGDPDTYQGTNWVSTSGTCDGTNDYCGVHTNSGVQNHWYYLLSVGGTGTNDNGDTYNVVGIGTAKAAAIAYRNLTHYLGSGSSYADAKNGSIQAARDLYGDCSKEVLQCARAWDAVGVNNSDVISYDATVDCPALNFVHGLGLSYTVHVFNDIRSNCTITANGAPVVFQAGHVITLQPGFRSGNNFHAFIDPCPGSVAPPGDASDRSEAGQPGQLVNTSKDNLSAFPNPFTGEITLGFNLETSTKVNFQLMDAFGRTVKTWFADSDLEADAYTVHFSDEQLPQGVYYAELRTGMGRWVKKLVKVNR
jgi:Zn-dependent metalloprotease